MRTKSLKEKIQERRPSRFYLEAVDKYNVSYVYVTQIANGTRSGSRGKGAEVKRFLESKIN